MIRLVVQTDGAQVAEVPCGTDTVFIGSREDCAVRLSDPAVGPHHAMLVPGHDDGWILQPLDPEHQVMLNGAPVRDRQTLRPGDQIQVAAYLIRVEQEAAESGGPAGPRTSVDSLTKFVQYQLPTGAIVKKNDDSLALQQQHVARIGQVNVRLAPCTTIEELMEVAFKTFFDCFGAHRMWIGVRRLNYGPMEYVEGRDVLGHAAELTGAAEKLRPRVLDRGQYVLLPRASLEESFSVLAGPLSGPEGQLGMIAIDTGDTGRRYDFADLDFFIALLHLFGVQADAIFKQMAEQRAKTISGEIVVAHAIQARLTPRKLPQWETLQWGAFREPGRERSSDIYDVVRMSNQQAAFMLAHTRAVGPMPSMLMSQTQATFRAAVMHNDPPNVFLKMLNLVLFDGQSDHALECFMGVLDPASGEMRYAVAGWMGAYIIGSRGDERPLRPRSAAPPLSLDRGASYPVMTETLERGENVVLFTPGVTTARNRHDEVFGEERFVNILCDGFGQQASAMLKEMLSDLRGFTEGGKQPDDITVLLAHRVEA